MFKDIDDTGNMKNVFETHTQETISGNEEKVRKLLSTQEGRYAVTSMLICIIRTAKEVDAGKHVYDMMTKNGLTAETIVSLMGKGYGT